jgi:hypothetical protein
LGEITDKENKMNKEMAVINLQLAKVLPSNKSSKGYIKYNQFMNLSHISAQDVIESLELLTGLKEGVKWMVVGCKTGKCRKTGGYTGYEMKIVRIKPHQQIWENK